MEAEAKVSTVENTKINLLFFKWDTSKYKFAKKRIKIAVLVIFLFFFGYTFIIALKRSESENIKTTTNLATFAIPKIADNQLINETTKVSKKVSNNTKKTKYSGPQLIYREAVGITPGTIAKAKLNTGASNGPVRAELTEDIISNGEKIFESGSLLIGKGSSNQDRLIVQFERLVNREGNQIPIKAQAFDKEDKMPGLKGNKVNTEISKLTAGIGLNFVGGLTEGLQDIENKGGIAVKSSSLKNSLLNGATHAAVDQTKELMDSYKEKAPVIQVEAGKKVIVVFE
jgi:hypothetical protein